MDYIRPGTYPGQGPQFIDGRTQQHVLCFEGMWPPNKTSDTTTDSWDANGRNHSGMLLEWWDVLPEERNRYADSDLAAPFKLGAVLADERFPSLPIGRSLVNQHRGSVTVPLAVIPRNDP